MSAPTCSYPDREVLTLGTRSQAQPLPKYTTSAFGQAAKALCAPYAEFATAFATLDGVRVALASEKGREAFEKVRQSLAALRCRVRLQFCAARRARMLRGPWLTHGPLVPAGPQRRPRLRRRALAAQPPDPRPHRDVHDAVARRDREPRRRQPDERAGPQGRRGRAQAHGASVVSL